MSLSQIARLPQKFLNGIVDWAIRLLTDPRPNYVGTEVTNLRNLIARVKVGDVLLICGTARISYVVKVLTQSQWSHVVLYIGDRSELLTEQERQEWIASYGLNSLKHLVVDADPVRGVHLKPLDESVGLMVRHCRPEAIASDDVAQVVDIAISQLGKSYDLRHIIRLLVFFAFPWELLPAGFRRMVTDFTLSEDDRICSRVLSEAFHRVGYPIRPLNVIRNPQGMHNRAIGVASGLRHRGRSAARLLAGGRFNAAFQRISSPRYLEFHLKGTRHITPADYDLSRFFSIIKDNEDLSIDYKHARALCPVTQKSNQ